MTTVDLQAEFFVPLQDAQDAIRAVWAVANDWSFSSPWGYSPASRPDNAPATRGLVDAMEFRQIKGGDGAWMSPHPVDSLGIHISFNGDPAYRKDIYEIHAPALERALERFGCRAHWGKLAPRTFEAATIEKLYGNSTEADTDNASSNLERFRALCTEHDPIGKFRNAHINQMLFGGQS